MESCDGWNKGGTQLRRQDDGNSTSDDSVTDCNACGVRGAFTAKDIAAGSMLLLRTDHGDFICCSAIYRDSIILCSTPSFRINVLQSVCHYVDRRSDVYNNPTSRKPSLHTYASLVLHSAVRARSRLSAHHSEGIPSITAASTQTIFKSSTNRDSGLRSFFGILSCSDTTSHSVRQIRTCFGDGVAGAPIIAHMLTKIPRPQSYNLTR